VRGFTTVPLPPGIPSLGSPSDNAADQPASLQLVWNNVAGAIKYHVQLATDNAFSGIIVDDSMLTSTSRSVGSLSPGTSYYWRVGAINTGGAGAWSANWKFVSIRIPDKVITLAPACSAVVATDSVVLVWNRAVPGVDLYRVDVYADSSMEKIILTDSVVVDTTKIIRNLSNRSSYWWRVAARNVAGWGVPAMLSRFDVRFPGTAVVPEKFFCRVNGVASSRTSINYELPEAAKVCIRMYDIKGRLRRTFVNELQPSGRYHVDLAASGLSKGCYLLDFSAGNYHVKQQVTSY
jgi:hypothetical protein